MRKWRAMSAAGPVALRPDRVPMVRALRRLVQMDLPDEVASTYLARIYEATTQDDVGVLEDLGLLLDRADDGRMPAAGVSASATTDVTAVLAGSTQRSKGSRATPEAR